MANNPSKSRVPPLSARSKASSSNSSEKDGFTFDPLKNMHLWTMWRIGNTEKIVNFTKYKTAKENVENGVQQGIFSGVPHGSPTLLVPPLARNILITDTTHRIAAKRMNISEVEKQSELKTGQFIYFGLPRVVLKNESSPTPR